MPDEGDTPEAQIAATRALADGSPDDASPEVAIASVHPPATLLVLAVASVALSAALLLVSNRVTDVVGYLLASVVTISLVGLFHRIDLQRRQSPLYASHRALGRWAGIVAALGVLVAALHTWSIATALAK